MEQLKEKLEGIVQRFLLAFLEDFLKGAVEDFLNEFFNEFLKDFIEKELEDIDLPQVLEGAEPEIDPDTVQLEIE